jgi:hypothetical protein
VEILNKKFIGLLVFAVGISSLYGTFGISTPFSLVLMAYGIYLRRR